MIVRMKRKITPDGTLRETTEFEGEAEDLLALQPVQPALPPGELEWYWDEDKIFPDRRSRWQKLRDGVELKWE